MMSHRIPGEFQGHTLWNRFYMLLFNRFRYIIFPGRSLSPGRALSSGIRARFVAAVSDSSQRSLVACQWLAGRGSLTDLVILLTCRGRWASGGRGRLGQRPRSLALLQLTREVAWIAWSQQAAVRSTLARPGDWRPQQVADQAGSELAVTCDLLTCDPLNSWAVLFLKNCFCI
ncbi:UNVERIFIED_CONTAM: hypothetical protein Sradi_3621000 [Sesamum radiatum]|uniref:Uncharacterized protein n=1 Tax=Sesamum radiatum TaxID=300843 RepID=A0AAW2QHM9_SESRA